MMLRFQRKNLLETQSSSSGDSDDYKADPLKKIESKNPFVRLLVLGKFKRMMNSYEGHELGAIDKKLLKGVFTRNVKDFKEDYRE